MITCQTKSLFFILMVAGIFLYSGCSASENTDIDTGSIDSQDADHDASEDTDVVNCASDNLAQSLDECLDRGCSGLHLLPLDNECQQLEQKHICIPHGEDDTMTAGHLYTRLEDGEWAVYLMDYRGDAGYPGFISCEFGDFGEEEMPTQCKACLDELFS